MHTKETPPTVWHRRCKSAAAARGVTSLALFVARSPGCFCLALGASLASLVIARLWSRGHPIERVRERVAGVEARDEILLQRQHGLGSRGVGDEWRLGGG